MAERKLGIICLLLCFCLLLVPCSADAVSTANAAGRIDPDQTCTLTISYHHEATVFSDLPVKLYRIADVSADFQYALTAAFQQSGLILNDVKTVGEWNAIRSTLEAYILSQGITEQFTGKSNYSGLVTFENLKPGLYLALPDETTAAQKNCSFIPSLVALPGLAPDGRWQYQTTVTAKSEILPPVEPDEEIQYTVLKLWKGDNRKIRPHEITIEIFRNGTRHQTVVLSDENQWSYSWTTTDTAANWTVVEQNIPEGYTVTVEKRSSTFVLTNTLLPREDKPSTSVLPKTGDTSNVLLYAMLMYLTGSVLILLEICRKSRRL